MHRAFSYIILCLIAASFIVKQKIPLTLMNFLTLESLVAFFFILTSTNQAKM